MKHQLLSDYSFSIEPYKSRLRLVVFKKDVELVCRKETKKNLQSFLLTEEAQLFKGRLQLKKIADAVTVQVKGEPIGAISTNTFEKLIDHLQIIQAEDCDITNAQKKND